MQREGLQDTIKQYFESFDYFDRGLFGEKVPSEVQVTRECNCFYTRR